MKTWDYADLSVLAKANGGPEALVDKLVNSGKVKMLPWLGVAFGFGAIALKLWQYFKQLKAKSTAELEAAKQEIIQGIRAYDDAHDEEIEKNKLTQKEENENG